MTQKQREQAIEVLQAKIDSIEDDQAYSQLSKSMYEDGYRRIDACKAAIAALRGPQPDPDTGLMKCGCGGKAGFHYSVMTRDNDCYVECGICGEHSKVALSEDEARDAWNAAMGWRVEE